MRDSSGMDVDKGTTNCPPEATPTDGLDFESLFMEDRQILLSFCRRHTDNLQQAEDLFQIVSVKAWRGFKSFRRECKFRTWILKIAQREAARRRPGLPKPSASRPIKLCSLDAMLEVNSGHPAVAVNAEAKDGGSLSPGVLRSVIPQALAEGRLKEAEAQVLLLRLDHPDKKLAELAPALGMTHLNIATIHHRALPKVLAYLLTDFSRFFGSLNLLRQAFERARSYLKDPLTEKEALVFENSVLLHRQGWRIKGHETSLRSSCAKVARFLKWLV